MASWLTQPSSRRVVGFLTGWEASYCGAVEQVKRCALANFVNTTPVALEDRDRDFLADDPC